MTLTIGACRADTDTRELTLHYRGRRRPDVSVFQLLQQNDAKGTDVSRPYTDCADTSHWRCHNCSRGKRVMEKLRRCHATFRIF